MRRIEEDYISKGLVRFVYRHFAFIGEESIRAAEAAECAAEQDAAWAYMDALFANQRGENRGAFSDGYLMAFARSVGLQELEFNACLNTRRHRDAVLEASRTAQSLGIKSTPTFFINGEMIQGLLPYEQFQEKIEAALATGG